MSIALLNRIKELEERVKALEEALKKTTCQKSPTKKS